VTPAVPRCGAKADHICSPFYSVSSRVLGDECVKNDHPVRFAFTPPEEGNDHPVRFAFTPPEEGNDHPVRFASTPPEEGN